MPTAEPSPDCTYTELARIVDENCAPFDTLAQVNRYIKAANMLWRREPSEAEGDGVRVSKRDLETQISKAERTRAVMIATSNTARPTHIVPTCDLE